MGKGTPHVEADAAVDAGSRDGAAGDERDPRLEAAAGVDAHLADPRAATDGQLQRARRDDALDERPVDSSRPHDALRSDERDGRPAEPHLRAQVDTSRLDE